MCGCVGFRDFVLFFAFLSVMLGRQLLSRLQALGFSRSCKSSVPWASRVKGLVLRVCTFCPTRFAEYRFAFRLIGSIGSSGFGGL